MIGLENLTQWPPSSWQLNANQVLNEITLETEKEIKEEKIDSSNMFFKSLGSADSRNKVQELYSNQLNTNKDFSS